MRRLYILFLVVPSLIHAQTRHQLTIEPFDIQYDDRFEFISSINQIESDGKNLYVRGLTHPYILMLTPDGKPIRQIGGPGGHPSKFGNQGVLAMSVKGPDLYAIDTELQLVRHFKHGKYADSFRLPSYQPNIGMISTNTFAFSQDRVVIPSGSTKGPAVVFHRNGTHIQHTGHIMPFTNDLNAYAPGINDAFWFRNENDWVSVHKYLPIVTRFDGQFNVVNQFQVESPIFQKQRDDLFRFSPTAKGNRPQPAVHDAQFHNGDLWLLSAGYLHQVDPDLGKLKRTYSFHGRGSNFEKLNDSRIALFAFAFRPDGSLILAHPGMLWGHDMWTASLPVEHQLKD